MQRLSAEQVEAVDPNTLLAVLGKQVICPGGRASTTSCSRGMSARWRD